jgi:hypothetical protein
LKKAVPYLFERRALFLLRTYPNVSSSPHITTKKTADIVTA